MKVTRPRPSVRQAILTLFGLFSLISILIGSAGVSYFVYTIEDEIWKERRLDAAQNASNTIERFVQRELDLMTFAAKTMHGPQYQDNVVLGLLFYSEPVFYELIQVDPSGGILHAIAIDQENLTSSFTIRQSNWFGQVKKNGAFVGSVEYSAAGKPYVILAISLPTGQILAARVNMNVLRDAVLKIQLGTTGQVYIVDANGYLLAHPDPAMMIGYTNLTEFLEMSGALSISGNTWNGAYQNFKGDAVMGSAVRTSLTHWTAIAEVTNSEIHQFSHLSWLTQIILLAIFGFVAVLISSNYMDRRVFRPLNTLRAGARMIQAGHLEVDIPISNQDEIGELARSFNQMAQSLQEHQFNLDQQSLELRKEVADRLAAQEALERLNLELEERVRLRTFELSELNGLLQDSETKFHNLVENIPAVVYTAELGPEGPILTYVSPQIGDMLGFSPPEWMDAGRWRSQIHPADYPIVEEYYQQMFENADRYALEYRLLSRNGRTVWVKDQGIIKEHSTSGRYIMGVMSNITLEREDKELLIQMALHDPLTGLPNRNLLVERLDHVIKRARRSPESKFALLYLDLDKFKEVNDNYSHASGDQVLIETGERIQSALREFDTVARFGGDEFVILVEDPKDEGAVLTLIDRIRTEIEKTFTVQGDPVNISASIGMTSSDEKFHDPFEMINAADLHMYRDKMQRRNKNKS